jgi:4-amino-4-deoxy-L-arabinose transferase-like glycosyltransferase
MGSKENYLKFLGIGLIIVLAIVIRIKYFVGFTLGDDLHYFNLVQQILQGHWVSYNYLNQYAYRPLLLLSVAGSFKLFGINETAFILPIFLASIGSIIVVLLLG